MKRAILLLMHQGKSYTEDIAAATAGLGLALVALSSRPKTPEVLEASRRHLADCVVTEEPELCSGDLDKAVRELADRGYRVEAAFASFEGYRLMMAELNARLGARDSAEPALRLCLDKYELRRRLFAEGLSEVRVHRLAPGATPELDPSARWFVKPVRGAASFAAFILENADDLADLPAIQEQMRADRSMKAIFMDRYDFLVEEYVEGPEFSFETFVLDGRVHHLCVHEKARVERLERTTLEGMSVSPPVSLGPELILEGGDFVARCLTALAEHGLTAGAFHIEVKYWESKKRWEIIEINTRMGGSLIDPSVRTVTGLSFFDLWIEALLLPDGERDAFHDRLARASQLEALRTGAPTRASVFLSKYGEKGRTVDAIRFDPPTRPPRILRVHVAEGTELEDSDRAICLMDALWDVAADDLDAEIAFLDRHATEHFHVRYRPPRAAPHSDPSVNVPSANPLVKENAMNRVQNSGITHPKPFYNEEQSRLKKAELDRYMDKKMAEWKATVPFASHLTEPELHEAYYRRTLIEHVWRIRLSRVSQSKAIYKIAQVSPRAARDYAQYQADEMLHDKLYISDAAAAGITEEEILATEPYLSTRLFEGFFYYALEHESAIAPVVSNYLVEYTQAKLQPAIVENLQTRLGKENVKGQAAHLHVDITEDHSQEMWDILHQLIFSEEDFQMVFKYIDDVQEILAMFFREIYEDTVAKKVEAAV